MSKVALITGASRGIGLSIARRFAEEKYNLFLVSRDSEKLAKSVRDLAEYNVAVDFLTVDVSNSEDVKRVFDSFSRKYNTLDVLVNNAGTASDNLLVKMSDEEWDKVMATNLNGAFYFCREAYRHMRKNGGSIINISSVIGLTGNSGQANYTASKAGLSGLTFSLAKEFAPKIRVNCVSPGYVETDLTAKLSEEQKKSIIERSLLKRAVKTEDVADAVFFLASNESITGINLVIDGGYLMG